MNQRSTIFFLVTYILTLCIFVWAGYYFYADYTLHTQVQKMQQQSGKFQTDLAYINLPRISVTLNSSHLNHSGNVVMDITLEVENKYATSVQSHQPRITDRLVHYSETLDYDELARPRSTVWLKPDLLLEVNKASAPAPVRDVIFREFIVM